MSEKRSESRIGPGDNSFYGPLEDPAGDAGYAEHPPRVDRRAGSPPRTGRAARAGCPRAGGVRGPCLGPRS